MRMYGNTVVVARFKEDTSWLHLVPSSFSTIIYEKNQQGLPTSLPNVGRESHTYLTHIVARYDDICNAAENTVTFFTQGSVHHPNAVEYLRQATESALLQGVSWAHAGQYEHPAEHAPRHSFRIAEWPPGNSVEPNRRGICFGEWFECVLQQRFPVKQKLWWIPGACFAVRNDYVALKPRDYYERLLLEVSHHNNPEEGHFFERSWLYLFSARPRYVMEVPVLSAPCRKEFARRVRVMQLDNRVPTVPDTTDLRFDDVSQYHKNSICLAFVNENRQSLSRYLRVLDPQSCTLHASAIPYYTLTSAMNAFQCDAAGMSYQYKCVAEALPDRASSWLKMAAILQGVDDEHGDIVVMLDSDAWIRDADALLDWLHFFSQSPQTLFFSDETSGSTSFDDSGTKMTVNGGLVAFKRGDGLVREFVQKVWDVPRACPGHERYLQEWPFEQMCLHRVLHDDARMATSTMLGPLALFNTPAGAIVRHDWTKKFVQTLLLLDLVDACLKRYAIVPTGAGVVPACS